MSSEILNTVLHSKAIKAWKRFSEKPARAARGNVVQRRTRARSPRVVVPNRVSTGRWIVALHEQSNVVFKCNHEVLGELMKARPILI